VSQEDPMSLHYHFLLQSMAAPLIKLIQAQHQTILQADCRWYTQKVQHCVSCPLFLISWFGYWLRLACDDTYSLLSNPGTPIKV